MVDAAAGLRVWWFSGGWKRGGFGGLAAHGGFGLRRRGASALGSQ